MGVIGCNEFLNYLEGWTEGQRHPDAQAHVRGCPDCRALAADLDAIHAAGGLLADPEVEPPARIWTELRAQLEKEGLVRNPGVSSGPSASRWFDRLFPSLPRPALAGAYMALLIGTALALTGSFNLQVAQNSWIETTRNSTLPLGAELDMAEQQTVSSFGTTDTVVNASLHENLAIVDNYITLCEKSVREEPENEAARDYLYGAYQQKADLLAQFTERGEPSQ